MAVIGSQVTGDLESMPNSDVARLSKGGGPLGSGSRGAGNRQWLVNV
jgi:hypothetical protein